MINPIIFLDYNSTTPCHPEVVEAMLPYFTGYFGNASSSNHSYGWQAAAAIEIAGEQVAELIGVNPEEILFTSGATESVNLAIKGVYEAYASRGRHIISFSTEHSAVLDTLRALEKLGAEITLLGVDERGQPNLEALDAACRKDTILIAAMYANNETGTIFPVQEISRLARKKNIIFFSDATQAVAKIPVDCARDGIDLVAFSAHKFYGPKGVGALFIRSRAPRVRVAAQIHGGGQQKNIRSGTLNVPGIVGMGKAAEMAAGRLNQAPGIASLRNRLETAILSLNNTFINGDIRSRLPNTCNMQFGDLDGKALLRELSKMMAIASGSACTSANPRPSHVLKAMGCSDEAAMASVRFSLGAQTTEAEVDSATEKISALVKVLREAS